MCIIIIYNYTRTWGFKTHSKTDATGVEVLSQALPRIVYDVSIVTRYYNSGGIPLILNAVRD